MTLFYQDTLDNIAEIRRAGFRLHKGERLAFTDTPDPSPELSAIRCEADEKILRVHEITGAMDLPEGRWWEMPAEAAALHVRML
jgi:hypothetical protein